MNPVLSRPARFLIRQGPTAIFSRQINLFGRIRTPPEELDIEPPDYSSFDSLPKLLAKANEKIEKARLSKDFDEMLGAREFCGVLLEKYEESLIQAKPARQLEVKEKYGKEMEQLKDQFLELCKRPDPRKIQ